MPQRLRNILTSTIVGLVDRADSESLDRLEPLLTALRQLPGLREANAGTFHRTDLVSRFWALFNKRSEFLHFHQADGPVVDHRCHQLGVLFADLRPSPRGTFRRFPVDTPGQCDSLLTEARSALTGR